MAYIEFNDPQLGSIKTQNIKYRTFDKAIIVIVRRPAVSNHLERTNGSLKHYKVFADQNFSKAASKFNKYFAKKKINELIIRTHGSPSGRIKIHPGSDNYDISPEGLIAYKDGSMKRHFTRKFERYNEVIEVSDKIRSCGKLIFTACEAGSNPSLIPELSYFIRNDVFIYLNVGTSSVLKGKTYPVRMLGYAEDNLKPETVYLKTGSMKGSNNKWFLRMRGGNIPYKLNQQTTKSEVDISTEVNNASNPPTIESSIDFSLQDEKKLILNTDIPEADKVGDILIVDAP